METCRWSARSPEIPTRPSPSRATPALPRAHLVRLLRRFRASAATGSSSAAVPVEPITKNRMFILGVGYVGKFFGKELLDSGWSVSSWVKWTCKSAEKRKELEDEGFDMYILDANEPKMSVLSSMKEYTHLLVSIPPMAGIGDLLLQQEHLLRNMLKGGNIQWLCYLSSTSVYGDSGGDWVDEDYPASPSNHMAKLRLDAEKGWLDLGGSLGISALVFRLGGIYGPGRSAIDTIIRKKPLTQGQKMRSSRQYTARVHIEDIGQALKASISVPPSSRIYNIVDDDPAPREEVFEFAHMLVEKKWPGHFKDDPSPETTGSIAIGASTRGEKRVSNARMKGELGVRLIHPSYKSGFHSIVEKTKIHSL
ncbi:hypothetical protein CRG98_044447 [Punica granatum]|uniref:NAD-dependent epimerase/dehydratase domain-containing protein n=1 Tax=Punica granatum TaxID=22663 RepID=A0A2I0HTZ2_PUNGR|nr:hypothetical protein CRG98_044447 [Punica granatum]